MWCPTIPGMSCMIWHGVGKERFSCWQWGENIFWLSLIENVTIWLLLGSQTSISLKSLMMTEDSTWCHGQQKVWCMSSETLYWHTESVMNIVLYWGGKLRHIIGEPGTEHVCWILFIGVRFLLYLLSAFSRYLLFLCSNPLVCDTNPKQWNIIVK